MEQFVERRKKKEDQRSGVKSQFQNPTEERRNKFFARRVMDRECLKSPEPVRQRLQFVEPDWLQPRSLVLA